MADKHWIDISNPLPSGDTPSYGALSMGAGPPGGGATITATLRDGPLAGRSVQVEVVEGRPPKTIDLPLDDGGLCRYCLADWMQSGSSAAYTFLYRL